MAGLIMVTSFDAATNADVLNAGRLQTVPRNGVLTFEFIAADNVAANHFVVQIQLPNGDVPVDGVLVPGGATAGLAGVMDDRMSLKLRFKIGQGGHCVLALTETGDTEVFSRITFQPIGG